MTSAGRTVELARYRIPSGERVLQAQRIDGRVAFLRGDRVVVVMVTRA